MLTTPPSCWFLSTRSPSRRHGRSGRGGVVCHSKEVGVHVAQIRGPFATPAARPGGRGGQVAAGGPLAAVPEWEDVIMAGCGGPGEQPEGVPEEGACAARRGLRWEGELGDIEMVGGASGAAQGALLRSLAVSESVDVSAQGSAVATFD